MPSIIHSSDCRKAHKAALDWMARWPNACKDCGAAGEVSWYEDVVGDGGPRMQMGDLCGTCLGNLKCPRCSGAIPDFEEEPVACETCGWKYNAHEEFSAPYDPQSEPYCCYTEEDIE